MSFLETLFASAIALFTAWMAIAFVANLIDADIVWDPPRRLLLLLGGLSVALALTVYVSFQPERIHRFSPILLAGCLGVSWLFVRLHRNPLEWSMVVILFLAVRGSLVLGVLVANAAFP